MYASKHQTTSKWLKSNQLGYLESHTSTDSLVAASRKWVEVSALACNYPAPRMRSEGSNDCSWTGLYGVYIYSKKNLKLKKYSLLEVHFNTGRLLFEFNGLQYRFAAGQVFVAFANPVSVLFG